MILYSSRPRHRSTQQLTSPIIDRRRWLVWVWLIFTVALATWQFIFVVQLIGDPQLLINDPELARRYLRMVRLENYTLILSLIGGGIALFLLLRKEHQKAVAQQEFFATFTHEIKTSIAGIKLRAERIASGSTKDLSPSFREDMVKDLNRLELQLENSLFLARAEESSLYFEKIQFRDLLGHIGSHADLQLHLKKTFTLTADRQALETIVKNIILNAANHGKAENLWIEAKPASGQEGYLEILFKDDGKGLSENKESLGQLFYRPTADSGSGIGLYLIRNLSERMKGQAYFRSPANEGFQVVLRLPGELNG